MQDDDALLEIVVDLRRVMLDLLLQLREIIARADLQKQEDHAGNNAQHPQKDLKDRRADPHFDGELLFDDGDVAPLFVDGAGQFVQFVCHGLVLLRFFGLRSVGIRGSVRIACCYCFLRFGIRGDFRIA